MTSDETEGERKFEVVVHLTGNYMIIDATEGELVGVTKILTAAMFDAWSGKPPYFCQFNLIPLDKPAEDGTKSIWVNIIRSDKIEGYYIRGGAKETIAERQIKLQEKLLKAVEKSVDDADRGDEWKQGGDDAD